jgi:hypothetical protein
LLTLIVTVFGFLKLYFRTSCSDRLIPRGEMQLLKLDWPFAESYSLPRLAGSRSILFSCSTLANIQERRDSGLPCTIVQELSEGNGIFVGFTPFLPAISKREPISLAFP